MVTRFYGRVTACAMHLQVFHNDGVCNELTHAAPRAILAVNWASERAEAYAEAAINPVIADTDGVDVDGVVSRIVERKRSGRANVVELEVERRGAGLGLYRTGAVGPPTNRQCGHGDEDFAQMCRFGHAELLMLL